MIRYPWFVDHPMTAWLEDLFTVSVRRLSATPFTSWFVDSLSSKSPNFSIAHST